MNDLTSTTDHLTFDIGTTKVSMRDELRFQQREVAGTPNYFIEDPVAGNFFRIGYLEFSFLSLLDGQRTLDQAVAIHATTLGAGAISPERAETLVRWLLDNELATTDDSTSSGRMLQRRAAHSRRQAMRWLNPLMLKIDLGSPNRFFTRLNQVAGWLVSRPVTIAWCILVLAGLLELCQNWERFSRGAIEVIAPSNWIWIGLTWVVIKVLHEFGHGLACRRLGGEVRSYGVTLIVFIPLPFVDVTSSWRFGRQRDRVLVSLAGMAVELALASVAVFVWSLSTDSFTTQIAYNVILTAGITTLLFNANPLMRFDGYYILIDLLGTPNLATRGQQWLRSASRWLFYGFAMAKVKKDWRHRFTAGYAIAAFVWRILISCSITLAAYSLLEGIGLLLAALSLVGFAALPAIRTSKFIIRGSETEQPDRKRFALVSVALLLLLTAVLSIPSSGTVAATAVVDYDPLAIIRARTDGFVRQVHLQAGQSVRRGQLLVTLENRETVNQRDEALLKLKASQLAAQQYFRNSNLAEFQTECEKQQAIRKRLVQLEAAVSELEIRSPIDGCIISADPDRLLGKYMNPGDEIISVGDPTRKKLVALVSQHRAQELLDVQGDSVSARLFGRWQREISGVLRLVEVRASRDIPHEALTAVAGGELAVRESAVSESKESAWELVDPQVRVEAATCNEQACELIAGQQAVLLIRMGEESIFTRMTRSVQKWLGDRIHANHGVVSSDESAEPEAL